MPDGQRRTDDRDSELMALELSGQLLPPRELYIQLRADIRAIPQAYPLMSNIHHFPRWTPGLVLAKITSAQITQIDASELGPATATHLFDGWFSVRFARRYHPVVLSALLKSQFGVEAAGPNYIVGDGDNITFTNIPPTAFTHFPWVGAIASRVSSPITTGSLPSRRWARQYWCANTEHHCLEHGSRTANALSSLELKGRCSRGAPSKTVWH